MKSVDRQYLFTMLLLLHVLGDYYLQTDAMSRRKKGDLSHTLRHSGIYALPFLLVFLFRSAGAVFLSAVLLHGAIDVLKCLLEKRAGKGYLKKVREREIYLLDQALHVLSLYLMARLLGGELSLRFPFQEGLFPILVWSLSLLVLFKPVNVTFKILFSRFSPKEMNPSSVTGAGASIGSLERILMLLFLAMGQYASVGLIMTAKSIARYDRISKDPIFAEYYLIGTLFSILSTLLVHLAMSQLL